MTQVQSTAAGLRVACDTVWRYRLLVVSTFAVLMAISVVAISFMPRSYRAGANILVVNGNSRNDPTLASPDLPALATSTGVLARVEEKLGLHVPLITLKHNVTAKPPAYKSGIMRIEYTDPTRDRAATIANGVADELVWFYNKLSTARYDDDLRTLDAELSKQRDRIKSIDTRLKARGGFHTAASDGKGQDGLVDDYNALQTQRALAGAELEGSMAAADAATTGAQTRAELSRRDILSADPLYRALQNEATVSESALAAAKSQYTSRYPGLPQLQAKVNSLKGQLEREANRALSAPHAFSPTVAGALSDQRKAEALVEANRAKVAALDSEVARRSQQLDGLAPLELLGLERESAMAEYRSIAAHRSQTLLDRADALSLGSVVVVDRAIGSEAQAGVGPLRLTATFALVCLLLALGLAFLADQLNPRLRRVAQIEQLYGKPVVATLGKTR